MASFLEGASVRKYTGGVCNSAQQGKTYTVQKQTDGRLGIGTDPDDLCHCADEWELVEEVIFKSTIMNLVEKFKLALKSEPEKTFIKAGVTTADGALTPDGKALFGAYLLNKHGADFKKDVVDPIVAAEEK